MQDASTSEVILCGVDTTMSYEGSQTRLTARLLVGWDAAAHLTQLVSRLSLEPGIYGVHWHRADSPTCFARAQILRGWSRTVQHNQRVRRSDGFLYTIAGG